VSDFFRDYFTYNRRERRGILLLAGLIALLLAWLFISQCIGNTEKYDLSSFEQEIDAFQKQQDSLEADSLKPEKDYADNEYKLPKELDLKKPERFEFDPNGLPVEEWKRLGLSDKQIRTIQNFESKGGKFRKKEDVKKMYCIPAELYASLEPFIVIPSSDKKDTLHAWYEKRATQKRDSIQRLKDLVVELNSADTIQLDKLKGIGMSFAKRIVKYRNMIGGFVSKEQLLEVYGFDQEKMDLVKDHISVNPALVTKININTASLDELKKHPYIKYNLANLICNYRKQHGAYKDLSELKKLDLVTEELYAKIVPYLTVE
jgi:competence protein ComEA